MVNGSASLPMPDNEEPSSHSLPRRWAHRILAMLPPGVKWERLSPKTRRFILMAVALGAVAIVARARRKRVGTLAAEAKPEHISLSAFLRACEVGLVPSVKVSPGGLIEAIGSNGVVQLTRLVPGSQNYVFNTIAKYCKDYSYFTPSPTGKSVFLRALRQIGIPLALVYLWYRLLMKILHKDESHDFGGDRRSRIPKTTFMDVVSPVASTELKEVVEYLNDPRAFARHGARPIRGVLLYGPSGTGKTLLARAVAGTAKAAFLSTSGSEFVDTYVGRGSARVRALFNQARALAPCVVFIDEIDALGSRGAGESRFGGGHEEYVQTLNQLLVELDGVCGHEGIVVLAASNRHAAIDRALLRPGRFDRHVFLNLPTTAERLEIIRIHSRQARFGPNVDLRVLAQATEGFTGADLANLVNESIYLSLRTGGNGVVRECDLCSALTKCRRLVQDREERPSGNPTPESSVVSID
ncbi:hypothetical protein FOZ63_023425 [Perkinsus olseni]|uniref:AAA+ ATPase domain-containing protein n=2 Tax=Perkinsus olseni TaxID=32597 RepID=A0A7J6SNH0_PEROL|nr:hypothetical protein FOZ63_023425 [Perkinsus olseni]